MTEPNSLLPCPFCGGVADIDAPTSIERLVYCKGCYASIAEDATPKAIAAWNRRAPAVPPNWQDIATAPKDGSVLLGWIVAPQEDWLDAFEAPSLIHWDAGFKSSISERKAGWVAQWRGAPTHWMPLPPPPEAASQPDSVNEGSAGGQA
jgi:Lar family restriction alleviation protein